MSADGYTWGEAMSEPIALDCGCRGETVDGTFVWVACPKGRACKWTRLVIETAEGTTKPLTVLDL